MSVLSKPYFHDEKAAFEKLEQVVWPKGPVCPHCGEADRIYVLAGVKDKKGRERYGLKKCGACRRQFTVRVGTVFESSHVPLRKWLQATHLLCSSKKGISAHQLHRVLEVTYKTAWFMAHRLREAMRDGTALPLGSEGKVVEADETYYGNWEPPIDPATGKPHKLLVKPRGVAYKRAVVALVERGGRARSFHVDAADKATVSKIVTENVTRETQLYTDESRLYHGADKHFAGHEAVKHSVKEYVRGNVHTNTVEGYFSIFKRGMKGVYQHCSEKHLHRYLAEFDFRYNFRGVSDLERTQSALNGILKKRLTYRGSRNVAM